MIHAAAPPKLSSSAAEKQSFCKRILFGVIYTPVVFRTLGARREISNMKEKGIQHFLHAYKRLKLQKIKILRCRQPG